MLKKFKSDFCNYYPACSQTYPKTVFDERIISDTREGLTKLVWASSGIIARKEEKVGRRK
jgi:hypothetical protein